LLIFFTDNYGEVGAPYFAQLAAGALFEVPYYGIGLFIYFQDFFGAEGGTDTAFLAPATIYFNIVHLSNTTIHCLPVSYQSV